MLDSIMLVAFGVALGVGVFAYAATRPAPPAPPEPTEKPRGRLKEGERVRILCAMPDVGLEAGELGTVKAVYVHDDMQFWVKPDNLEHAVCFEEGSDDWLLERAEGATA